jgi:hypothetical protein
MTPEQPTQLTLNLNGWVGAFHQELDALLSDMMQLCEAARQNRYGATAADDGAGIHMRIQNAEALGAGAPQRAARNAFIGAMSKFSGFLDRLIASGNVMRGDVPVTRVLSGDAEIFAYVMEVIDEAVAAVARDHRLTFPKKLDSFVGLDTSVREIAINYNKLRNALEHHHDMPREEIRVKVRRIVPTVDGEEMRSLPFVVQKGGRLGCKIEEEEKVYPANTRVVLGPQDGRDLIFTIRFILALKLFECHVGAGTPTQAQAQP